MGIAKNSRITQGFSSVYPKRFNTLSARINEKSKSGETTQSTAADFLAELPDSSTAILDKEGRTSIPGVKMRDLFALAKKHMDMAVVEIEKLLKSPVYEHRVGAVSIMDWKARSKKTTEAERKALFDLYIKRHDCIDDWSLVDRAAPYVVGGYLDLMLRHLLGRWFNFEHADYSRPLY